MIILNFDAEKVKWISSINQEEAQHAVGITKLRSYNTFKTSFKAEPCVNATLPRTKGRAFVQFKAGVVPLALGTGRYQGLSVQSIS